MYTFGGTSFKKCFGPLLEELVAENEETEKHSGYGLMRPSISLEVHFYGGIKNFTVQKRCRGFCLSLQIGIPPVFFTFFSSLFDCVFSLSLALCGRSVKFLYCYV